MVVEVCSFQIFRFQRGMIILIKGHQRDEKHQINHGW